MSAVIIKSGLAIATALATTGLAACKTIPPTKGAPAVLQQASDATTAELTEIISTALHGVRVTLAPDALTTDSTIIIEKQNFAAIGRRMDRPDHFTLSLSNNKCVLTHEQTGKHYALKHAKCKAVQ